MKVKLEIIKGPQVGRSFEFSEPDTFLVGRAKDATFRLPEEDPYVSRRHFHLEINPPKCFFRDLQSTNPPKINNEVIVEKELQNGDIIQVGYTQMKVTITHDIITRKIQCRKCKTDIVLIVNEKHNGYCNNCLKALEEEKIPKPNTIRQHINCRCGKDLTHFAYSDNQFDILKGKVNYSCKSCLPAGDKEKGIKIKDYEVIRKVGEGGMGKVYLVYHAPTARILVCKKILGLSQQELVARFDREIRLQKSITHENIIQFVDSGIEKNEPFMISEFASGGDLNKFLIENRLSMTADKAVEFTINALNGLEYMHSNSIIHRDIKPENILLQREENGKLIPKISDFGLAKSYNNAGGSSFTRVGTGMGTLFYMAPEQMKDAKSVDGRADVYSFGISLYYLLTGKYPYEFPSPIDLIQWMLLNKDRFENEEEAFQAMLKIQKQRNPMLIILSNNPIPIINRNSQISQKLANVVDKAIEKDISKRIQSAREFRAMLQNC
jgi:eukaryotic-like serine/threonine-protein kinase